MNTERNIALSNRRIIGGSPLITPRELKNLYPMSEEVRQGLIARREEFESILEGRDPRTVIMTGPCSIHNVHEGVAYARKLKKLADKVSDKILVLMRTYFEKPRTIDGWKGLIVQPIVRPEEHPLESQPDNIDLGLRTARQFLIEIAKIGLGTVTEFLDPLIPQYLGELITTGTIGARTTESQTHRLMASGLSCSIGFKNGTDGDVTTAINALLASRCNHSFTGIDEDGRVSVFQASGNQHGYVVHRGGKDSTNFDPTSISSTLETMKKKGVPPRLLIDCSHGNSMKKHENQVFAFQVAMSQIIGWKEGLFGVMLESNLEPGRQDAITGTALLPGVSITDECIGFEEAENLILSAHSRL